MLKHMKIFMKCSKQNLVNRLSFISLFLLSIIYLLISRRISWVQYFSFLSMFFMFIPLINLIIKKDRLSLFFIILTSFLIRSYPLLRTPYLYTNNVWSNAYIIDIVLKTGKVPLQVMQHPENAHVSWPFHYYVEAIICKLTGLSAFFVEKWIGNILFGPLILVLFYFIGKEFKLNEEERLKTVLFIGIIASFYNNIYSHSTNIPEFLMVSMFYFALKKNLLSKLLVLLFGVLLMNTHPLTFIFSFFFIIPVIYSDVKKKNFLFLSYLIPLLFALDFFWFHTIYPFMFKNIKAMLEALNLKNLIPFYEIIFFMCLIFGLLLLYLLCEVINRINIKFNFNNLILIQLQSNSKLLF